MLLRPAVDTNLTLRFLVANPTVNLDLWEAEGDLELLKWIGEIEGDADLGTLMAWQPTSAEFRADLANRIAAARGKALSNQVKGVSTKARGRVMPATRDLAVMHGDLTTRHAYAAAYRLLSQFTHPSARGFTLGEFVSVNGDRVKFEELVDPERRMRAHRALNAATFASTLTVIDGSLELDIIDVAARIRDILVTMNIVEQEEATV